MTKFFIEYLNDLQTKCTHTDNLSTLITDAPKDNMGKGEEFSPTDLVAVALGSCLLTIMGIAAKKLKVALVDLSATVQKEMATAPSRRIGKLTVEIRCKKIDPKSQKMIEAFALTCPVHESLHPDVKQDITFEWL